MINQSGLKGPDMNELNQLAYDTGIAIQLLQQQVDDICSDNDDWIDAGQASQMLGVSRARASKMCADGVIRSANGRNRCYVYKPDVLARIDYIRKHGKPTRGKRLI